MALQRDPVIRTREEGRKVHKSRASRAFLVLLLPRMPLAAVGYLDGTLAIYDLSTQTLRHQCQHQVWCLGLCSYSAGYCAG